MSNLTPAEAFEHAKALWPAIQSIRRYHETEDSLGWVVVGFILQRFDAKIDWPADVDRWPPPEPEWREPTMTDVGKMVEFCNYKGFGSVIHGKLIYIRDCTDFHPRFVYAQGLRDEVHLASFARIRKEPS
jgi:hypothetical protein